MRKNQGVVTIFILLVLIVFVIFACVIVDLARIKLFESDANKVVEASFTSVLAGYTKEIMEQYGLFANYDDGYIGDIFAEYLEKNMSEEQKEGFLRLYDIKIENIEVTPVYTLNNDEVIIQQIYKYMRYRAPVNIAKFLSKLTEINKYGSTSKLSKLKLNLDRKLGQASKKYMDINDKLKELDLKRDSVEENLEKYAEYITEINNAADDEDISEVEKKRDKIQNLIEENFDDSKELAQDIISEYYEVDKIEVGLKDNINEIDEIIRTSKDKMIEDYVDNLENEISKIDNTINKDSKISIDTRFSSNLDIVKDAYAKFRNMNSSKVDEIITELEKCNFTQIKFSNTNTVDMSYKNLDDRDKRADEVTDELDNKDTNKKEIPDEVYKNLPSNSEPYNIENRVDFSENSGENISDNAFELSSNMVFEITNDLVNEIYINEYIMSIFDNQTNHKEGIGRKDQFFDYEIEYILNGCRKQSDNVTYTNSKIFMIRFAINAMHVYTSQPKLELATMIATAASSVTGGLSMPIIQNMILCSWAASESIDDLNTLLKGKEIPLFKTEQNWSTNISGLIKNKNTEERGVNIYTSYDDYMRLLLLITSSKTKIDRVKNLLQLNLGTIKKDFELENCTVIYKVKVDFSINYMFMTEGFMPEEYKKAGRHVCVVETYLGY